MTHKYTPLVDTSNWYKENFFWFDPDDPWETRMYGKVTNNKFDLIGNTMYKVCIDEDVSEWAQYAIRCCRYLLLKRMRWPNWYSQPDDPKTRIGWRIRNRIWLIRRWLRKHLLNKKMDGIIRVYGHQKRMSRDPFIWFYTACALHKKWNYIEEVTIPWYINRLSMWLWRRRLIRDKRKDYVRRLELAEALAITYNIER